MTKLAKLSFKVLVSLGTKSLTTDDTATNDSSLMTIDQFHVLLMMPFSVLTSSRTSTYDAFSTPWQMTNILANPPIQTDWDWKWKSR